MAPSLYRARSKRRNVGFIPQRVSYAGRDCHLAGFKPDSLFCVYRKYIDGTSKLPVSHGPLEWSESHVKQE